MQTRHHVIPILPHPNSSPKRLFSNPFGLHGLILKAQWIRVQPNPITQGKRIDVFPQPHKLGPSLFCPGFADSKPLNGWPLEFLYRRFFCFSWLDWEQCSFSLSSPYPKISQQFLDSKNLHCSIPLPLDKIVLCLWLVTCLSCLFPGKKSKEQWERKAIFYKFPKIIIDSFWVSLDFGLCFVGVVLIEDFFTHSGVNELELGFWLGFGE